MRKFFTLLNLMLLAVCAFAQNDPEPLSYPVTAVWNFGDASTQEAVMALSGSSESGEIDDMAKDGLKMTVIPNGATFRVNGNNMQLRNGVEFQIPVNTTDDVITVNGYQNYSYYTIGGGEELNNENTYKPTAKDVKRGYVSIVSTNDNNYFYTITLVLNEKKESGALENVASTATFPFTEGTEDQKAEFGDQADHFLNSKVVLGSNMSITGQRTFSEINWTKIQPKTDTTKDRGNNDNVDFIIQPKAGLTFTPSSVSLKVAKCGTDNGKVDVVWLNADGTVINLATGVVPQRNNADPAYSSLSYDITEAPASDGACGLRVYIYGKLVTTKDMALSDIVINGVLNGEEAPVPVLADFTANGVSYIADNVFEADGETFKATIELSKSEPMISADNPVSATALEGELGEITYDGDETKCTATIPVTLGSITINYIVSFVQKPDFTLTYYNTDGTEMGTQAVEKDAAIGAFNVDYTTAKAEDGFKVRGWFYKNFGGKKASTADIITEDTPVYAVATEIEGPSNYKKYTFDLTSDTFYPEDHEAFVNDNGCGYWHDNTHGWAFRQGDRIALLVGPKAIISVGLCKYGASDNILKFTDAEGNELGTIAGIAENDGEVASFVYEGEGGTIYMTFTQGNGESYIHSLKIVNTTETNFTENGDWYIVKKDNASSLIDVLDYVCGLNSSADATRKFIFLPDGTYDLGHTMLTTISGHNISIVGESKEGTIIKNKPNPDEEGIGNTATLLNTSTNLYVQDLTIQNEYDYYNKPTGNGRAVCLQDKGDQAVFKNVALKSHQDTYYSQNTQRSYWETSDLYGTVDFICGGGDVRFQDCNLYLEPRQSDSKGSRTITAPTTSTSYGYVFDSCKVIDLAEGKGDWNFGRAWNNQPICVWLNTTLDTNAANTLISKRWIEKGMNNTDPKVFGEYGTKNESGDNITPASNKITSFGGEFETILSADDADFYKYENMFGRANWPAKDFTVQMGAPNAKYEDGTLTVTPADDNAIAWAVYKNGEFVDIMTDNAYDIEAVEGDKLSVRTANPMGGFGPKTEIDVVTGIETISAEAAANLYDSIRSGKVFDLNGRSVNSLVRGNIYVVDGKKTLVK